MQTFKTSKAKENILARIRKELSGSKLPMPYPEEDKNSGGVYTTDATSPEEEFVVNFKQLGGKFVFCDDVNEAVNTITILAGNHDWKQVLCADEYILNLFQQRGAGFVHPATEPQEAADACITGCEALIARTGSMLLSSAQFMGRTAPVYYPVHIAVAYIDQVHNDISDGFRLLKKKYGDNIPSMINLATGPSRTADIEKTLVVGVHGPAEVYCILVNAEMPV